MASDFRLTPGWHAPIITFGPASVAPFSGAQSRRPMATAERSETSPLVSVGLVPAEACAASAESVTTNDVAQALLDTRQRANTNNMARKEKNTVLDDAGNDADVFINSLDCCERFSLNPWAAITPPT